MWLVESAGIEAILPKVSYTTAAGVEVEGVPAMSAAQGHSEGKSLIRDRHEVDMIAHQAISKNAKTSLRTVRLEAVEIGATVSVREENTLLVNTALRDMVRHSNGDCARKSGHLLKSGVRVRFLSSYHISPSPKSPKSPEVPPKSPPWSGPQK
jgi:hypothetical protein